MLHLVTIVITKGSILPLYVATFEVRMIGNNQLQYGGAGILVHPLNTICCWVMLAWNTTGI